MCVFCKIINGEIPSYKVYEDDVCLAFLDMSQATIGHTLVVPKEHVENIFELSESQAAEVYSRVVKVANKLRKGLEISDLNLLNNNGPIAGQTVNHYHVHLLPRTRGDNLEFIFESKSPSALDMTGIQTKINLSL